MRYESKIYCARQGWTFEVVVDLGSGMNSHKKSLKRLLNDIIADRVGRLVVVRPAWACALR